MTTPIDQSSAINTSADQVCDPLYQEEQPMTPHTDIPEAELTADGKGLTLRVKVRWKHLRPIATHIAASLAPWLLAFPHSIDLLPVPPSQPSRTPICLPMEAPTAVPQSKFED
jgi:hypothetical protein